MRALAGSFLLLCLLAACGGEDDGPSAYREQAEEICQDAKREAPDDQPTTNEEMISYLEQGIEAAEDRTRRWNRLEPPTELVAEHERVMVARDAEIDFTRRLLARLRRSRDPLVAYARAYPRAIERYRATNRAYRAAGLDECVQEEIERPK